MFCSLHDHWGHSAAQCIQLKSCNKCGHKGHLARSCPHKGAHVRSSSFQGMNLIDHTIGESLVPLLRSFMEEASGSEHKIASIAAKNIGEVSHKKLGLVVGFLGACNKKR